MLLFLLACSVADGPACLNEPMHACSDIEIAQSCNALFAFDGLHVDFTGGTAAAYDAVVTMDGVESSFSCDGTSATTRSGTVWSCDGSGFWVSGSGDAVDIQVTTDTQTFTGTFEPCWDATEPNGACCGWNFQATVELPLG